MKRREWTWYATGPGGAITLANGTLLVPATHAAPLADRRRGDENHAHVLASHDGGASWHVGADAALHTNEATVAQLANLSARASPPLSPHAKNP